MEHLNPFIPPQPAPPEFHSAVTISLGELITAGWIDWSEESWKWDYYNEEQYDRVCHKIQEHYWTREIGILPPGEWKRRYISLMNEIMPKYKLLYAEIDKGLNIMQDSDAYGKSRDIFSEFPQTALGGNQDYASNGNDREYEDIRLGSPLDKIGQFVREYNDVDLLILSDIEIIFSSLISVNLNMF